MMGRPLRVVVVDDSRLMRGIIRTALEAEGDIVAVGAGCVGSPRAAACGGAWLLWVDGERVARVETPTHVVAVAVHAVSRRVAASHTRRLAWGCLPPRRHGHGRRPGDRGPPEAH